MLLLRVPLQLRQILLIRDTFGNATTKTTASATTVLTKHNIVTNTTTTPTLAYH
jgi:predicted choloylglycine hydrolase